MRRLLRVAAAALCALLLVAACLAASLAVHLQLPLARRAAAAWLSDTVSHAIRGGLAIGRLERVSPLEVVARRVVLFDADGRRIIVADRLVLRPDLAAALAGQWRLASAKLDGATVRLYDEGEGLPTLLSTFDAPRSATSAPSSGEPLHVRVDGIELTRVLLTGDLLGLHDLRVPDLSAGGAMDIGRELHVRIDHARGSLTQPFGFVGHLDALSGTISTVTSEGVVLHANTHRDQEQASAVIRYGTPKHRPKAAQQLTLEVHAQRVTSATLQGLGYGWVPALAIPVSGDLSLQGPVGDLALNAQLDTDAGHVAINGSISQQRGVAVTLQSDALEVARLFPDYPKLVVDGSLHIDSPKGAEQPSLHAEVEPLLYGKLAIPGFSLDAVIEDTGLRIDRIDARSRNARILGHGRIEKTGAIAFDLTASFNDIGADPNLKRIVPDASGRLDVSLHVRTQQVGQAKLDFDGQLSLSNFRYGVIAAKRLTLRGSAHGDPERPRLNVRVSGSDLRLGDYLLGDPSLALRGGPRQYTADGEFNSAGKRTFNVSARITADATGVVIDADPIELTVGEGSWRGAMHELRVIGQQSVELGLLRLASRSQRLEAHGIVRFHGDDALDAQLQDFDLAALRALLGERLPVSEGRADAHVVLKGDLSSPDLSLQGALRDGVVQGVKGVNALYLITYRAGAIETDGDVDLGDRGAFRVTGSGRIDRSLSDPVKALRLGSYQLELSGQSISLSLLPQAQQRGLSGTLSGSLRFTGTLDDPSFEGELRLDSLTAPGWSPLSIAASGGYARGELNTRVSVADEHGPLLSASGDLQLDWHALMAEPELLARTLMHGPWHVSGQVSRRPLARMPQPLSLPYPIAVSAEFDLQRSGGASSGTVRFDGAYTKELGGSSCGGALKPEVRGALQLQNEASSISLTLFAGSNRVGNLELQLDTPVDRWAERGRMEMPKLLHASGKLDARSIETLPYLCELGQGTLGAELELASGLTDHPLLSVALDASFVPRADNAGLRKRTVVPSCQGDPIKVHFDASADKETLSGAGQMQGCHGGATTLQGKLKVSWQRLHVLPTPDENGALQALLRFEGSQLKPLMDRIPGVLNAEATAYGQVKVSGTPKRPQTSGQLNISGGRLYLVSTGQELTNITARLTFLGDWARLEHLQAQAGDGRLEAVGGIGFVGLWPQRLRLALRATQLPIKREGVDTAWLSGGAAVDADITPERAHAVIELQQLDVRLPDVTNRTLQPLDPNPEVVVTTAPPEQRAEPYPIELVIQGKRKLNVHRNDFQADIATELAVSYRNPDLTVGGYITFGSGQFEILRQALRDQQRLAALQRRHRAQPRRAAGRHPEDRGGRHLPGHGFGHRHPGRAGRDLLLGRLPRGVGRDHLPGLGPVLRGRPGPGPGIGRRPGRVRLRHRERRADPGRAARAVRFHAAHRAGAHQLGRPAGQSGLLDRIDHPQVHAQAGAARLRRGRGVHAELHRHRRRAERREHHLLATVLDRALLPSQYRGLGSLRARQLGCGRAVGAVIGITGSHPESEPKSRLTRAKRMQQQGGKTGRTGGCSTREVLPLFPPSCDS